ncbi:coiled-coil-helix-coiled-coil-helix domain-containing protein 1 [Belonocnema kinseyi]|uniref:coiled-coil-helix-coiled-coil-helix domain-containing protein 1 n=1 Tax=Belonocnema kinseyi TaxID=2817044 RepID=UPI00143D0C5E|nr:coiled-coil-helix-coiled-coil-helix domain-containing protein 1 [Belonocnema kinseyi]XP_033222034.1 coiled-coil-helix-coiled-coil-helix domain-containing protein 1 [Belonocnema kinseyi]XP_033222036.1 coiled-coil-helix-coiled-coil-helix domain-containing protein 1 [Belonocnema kinseyi]XP_033222037.1 coiled-coil-helix-coiled-coil-helix domain-containing protein 1 [Belonocnema kinseyi]XP_033222038.1 coiled-coil-helix-coiled-coil-helix domain-containing protein 1 [Belonocnema kinseyi]
MRGSHLLLSKACKNSARARQCEDKVKFQPILPLQLKNKVSGKSDTDKEKGCLYEISVVIACLSKHNYENKFCEKEVKEFNNCFTTHMAKVRALKKNRDKGVLTPNAKSLNHREINMLFRRFPLQ